MPEKAEGTMTEDTTIELPCPKCGEPSRPGSSNSGAVMNEPHLLLLDGWKFADRQCPCGYWPKWREEDGQWEIW
jgi:hypothetical protein